MPKTPRPLLVCRCGERAGPARCRVQLNTPRKNPGGHAQVKVGDERHVKGEPSLVYRWAYLFPAAAVINPICSGVTTDPRDATAMEPHLE